MRKHVHHVPRRRPQSQIANPKSKIPRPTPHLRSSPNLRGTLPTQPATLPTAHLPDPAIRHPPFSILVFIIHHAPILPPRRPQSETYRRFDTLFLLDDFLQKNSGLNQYPCGIHEI